MSDRLQKIFSKYDWAGMKGADSRSGPGSSLAYTQDLRDQLIPFLQKHGVSSMIDGACGDWNWMQHVDLSGIDYTGFDVVDEIALHNAATYSAPNIRFAQNDLTTGDFPKADVLMARDVLFHFRFETVWAFFENFMRADIPLLLATNQFNAKNIQTPDDGWGRLLNLRIAPFHLEAPIDVLRDYPRGTDDAPRELALWHKDSIAKALEARSE